MQDDGGRTALYHALSAFHIKTAKDLLLKGCDFLLKDNNGLGPLDLNLKDHAVCYFPFIEILIAVFSFGFLN